MISRILFILLIVLASCSTKKSIQIVEREVIKDTVVYVEKYSKIYDTITLLPDSSYIEAYFECDSNNNLMLKRLHEIEGSKINIRTIYRDNTIKIYADVDSATIIRQAEESIINTYKSTVKEDTNQTITKEVKRGINFLHVIISVIVGFLLYRPIMFIVKIILKLKNSIV